MKRRFIIYYINPHYWAKNHLNPLQLIDHLLLSIIMIITIQVYHIRKQRPNQWLTTASFLHCLSLLVQNLCYRGQRTMSTMTLIQFLSKNLYCCQQWHSGTEAITISNNWIQFASLLMVSPCLQQHTMPTTACINTTRFGEYSHILLYRRWYLYSYIYYQLKSIKNFKLLLFFAVVIILIQNNKSTTTPTTNYSKYLLLVPVLIYQDQDQDHLQ